MGWTRKSGLPANPAAQSEAEPGEPLPVDSEPVGEPAVSGPWLEIIDRLSALEAKEEDHHRRASHRESVIDQLHGQNEELLAGMRRGVLEPVVSDLIRLYDGLYRESARLAALDVGTAKLIASFVADVELILDRCGLDPFGAEPGDAFTAGEHSALSVRLTDDPAKDNTVAEVVRLGFRDRESGRIRRPVQAHYFRLKELPNNEGP
jgi:molecular chaperone GrpE (heat shock protein)